MRESGTIIKAGRIERLKDMRWKTKHKDWRVGLYLRIGSEGVIRQKVTQIETSVTATRSLREKQHPTQRKHLNLIRN